LLIACFFLIGLVDCLFLGSWFQFCEWEYFSQALLPYSAWLLIVCSHHASRSRRFPPQEDCHFLQAVGEWGGKNEEEKEVARRRW
jgi:hypothetical protein